MTPINPVSILLVDDYPENLIALEAILRNTGHALVRARSGTEALKAVLRQEFALILMDVVMPDLGGYETAELIRGRARSRATPIIFLTANVKSDTHIFRGYSVGAVDYLFKPFVPEVLLSKVGVFVELYAKRLALEESANALRQAYGQLERRVEERTDELRQSNRLLQAEMIERQRVELERTELLERERHARLEAQAVSRTKDEFLATLSHELRTPLNAILGWAQIVEAKRDDATIERAIRAIKRNAQSQAQLVADILDVSRIIGGKLNLQLNRVTLQRVIEAALESVRPAADAKGITIRTELAQLEPIVADGDRLQQVLWNLLSNAIKFTPKGGHVRVGMVTNGDDITLTVADSGQGIEPDFIPRVFDRFTQAETSISRLHGGLGLGMAIVRHLVELHGGTVTAASGGKDQGATFTVLLPRVVRPAEGQTPTCERHVEIRWPGWEQLPTLDDITVLVVDDDADAREVIEEMLRLQRAQVRVTVSAAEAFQAFTERRPQVLISDLAMPVQDGLDLIRRIRRLQPQDGGQVPAIALTAHAGPNDTMTALAAGFQRHVTKPVDPKELIEAVAQLAGVDRVQKT